MSKRFILTLFVIQPRKQKCKYFRNGDEGSTIIDDSTIIKVYKVGDNQNLPDSNRIYDYSEYEDVTNDDYAQLGNNNDVNINFGNIDSPYIIKVISKYDPNKDDYTTIQQP